jgi:tetratricopeptide (TPR) repeat protein
VSRLAGPRRRRPAALLLVAALALSACVTISLGETIEALLAQIRELLSARRWDEALTRVAEVIRRDPAQWRAYLYGAQAYIGKADWGQALASARKALELAPRESEVVATLARALWGAGREALERRAWADAAAHFTEYIRLRPAEVSGYLEAGRAHLGLGRWSEAGRVLVEGLGRAPDAAARAPLVQALLEGGRQALSRGDLRGAVGLLGEYVRQSPGDVSGLLDLGKAHWGAGDRAEAIGVFRRVLELAPGNEEARRFLLGR